MKFGKTGWALRLVALILTGAALAGCAELVVGTAVVGTLAASDRRSLGAQTDDKLIALKADDRITTKYGHRAHVNVTAYNRRVLLTGEVPDTITKQDVERIVSEIENVRGVVNDLEMGAQSSITVRSNDTLITGKVKASFVDAKDIFVNSIKVVTDKNTVYLLGLVTEREANRATEIARNVGGVQRVVKVFELITEEELARMANTKAAAAPPQK